MRELANLEQKMISECYLTLGSDKYPALMEAHMRNFIWLATKATKIRQKLQNYGKI